MGLVSEDVLSLIKREMETNPEQIIRMCDLAKQYNVSRKDLHYSFIRKYGISIRDYHSRMKFGLFNILMREKNGSLYKTSYDVALTLGFKSDSSLQNFIKKMTGLTFKQYLDYLKDFWSDH